jgi:hypothetical protein
MFCFWTNEVLHFNLKAMSFYPFLTVYNQQRLGKGVCSPFVLLTVDIYWFPITGVFSFYAPVNLCRRRNRAQYDCENLWVIRCGFSNINVRNTCSYTYLLVSMHNHGNLFPYNLKEVRANIAKLCVVEQAEEDHSSRYHNNLKVRKRVWKQIGRTFPWIPQSCRRKKVSFWIKGIWVHMILSIVCFLNFPYCIVNSWLKESWSLNKLK